MADDMKVKIGADVSGFQKGASQVSDQLKEMGGFAGKLGGQLSKFTGPAMMAAGALSAVAVAAGVLTMKAINAAEEMHKFSQITGLTVENLSTLKYAADQQEVSFESLTTGVRFLNRSMGEAAQGSKEASQMFKNYGINIADSNGNLRDTNDILMEVADKFQGLPDGAQKAAIAMKLFGRGGVEMIPLLNEGAAGIERLQSKARDLGLEIGTNTAVEADRFNDTISSLKGLLTGMGNKLAENLIGPLNEVATSTYEALVESGVFNDFLQNVLVPTAQGVGVALKTIASAAQLIGGAYKMMAQEQGVPDIDTGGFLQPGMTSGAFDEVRAQGEAIKTEMDDIGDFILEVWSAKTSQIPTKVKTALDKTLEYQKAFSNSMAASTSSAASGMVQTWAEGTANMRGVLNSFFSTVLSSTIDFGIKQIGIYAAIQKAFTAIGTFGGLFIIGAALAGLMLTKKATSFASGTDYVPRDMPANIHEGERVVPRETNKDLTAMLEERKNGEMVQTNVYLDSRLIFEVINQGMKDGRLTVPARAVR